MNRTDVIIIGGGQAGLAMSHCLTAKGIAHAVLERGRVGECWRSERWDSLRLLTPRWQSRLPGWTYSGRDPHGFMSLHEVIDFLEGYRQDHALPVEEQTEVTAVRLDGSDYVVATDHGTHRARSVVVATGHAAVPALPAMAKELSPRIHQVVPARYKRPDQLPPGGVLVVGASATGVQLADELARSGREVTLAVGRHTRLPRRYRGRDIMWWLDVMGVLDETSDEVFDFAASREQPSLQLVGRPDHASLDLGLLQERGVRLAGRAVSMDGGRVTFAGDLAFSTAAADDKLQRLLDRIDGFVERQGWRPWVGQRTTIAPVRPAPAPYGLDLEREGIQTVLWATGFKPEYPWLEVPVVDERGEIRQTGGVTDAPGFYTLGLRFMRRRKSSFLDGVGDDARHLTGILARHLEQRAAA